MTKTPGGNKKTVGSIRAKANMPAKAGRRKLYGKNSKRKTKHFGGYDGFSMDYDVKHHPFGVPTGVVRTRGMRDLDAAERADGNLGSDPFKWKRTKAHFLSGVITAKDVQEKSYI